LCGGTARSARGCLATPDSLQDKGNYVGENEDDEVLDCQCRTPR
jgi:hypothetical protein